MSGLEEIIHTFSFTVPSDIEYEYSFWVQNAWGTSTTIKEWDSVDFTGEPLKSFNPLIHPSGGVLLEREKLIQLSQTQGQILHIILMFNMSLKWCIHRILLRDLK